MSHQLACTVIIPTYNRKQLLGYTLDSLVRQDLGTDAFEVLVVDDGSSDGTDQLVAEYRHRLNVRYFFQPDEGFRAAAARNVGIANAAADVCVFIDSGVLLHSRGLRAHVRSHTDGDQVTVIGYVYCFNLDAEDAALMRRNLNVADVDACIAELNRAGRWLDHREAFYARYGDALDGLPAPWLVYWACNISAGTAQLRAIGAFDEAFRSWGGEDTDLGYRLHRDGARFVLNREASAIHYPHEKDRAKNASEQMDNLRYIARKYDTPIVRLLVADPPIKFYDINDHIREQGVPTCAEYLATTRT